MTTKKYIFLLLIIVSYSSIGQNTGFYWNNLKESSNRLQGKIMGEIYYVSPLDGRLFFLQDDWIEGTIELENGDIIENIQIRYNCNIDELIAYNQRIRTLFAVDKNIMKRFLFKDYSFNRDSYKEREFIKLKYDGLYGGDRYFEKLYSGEGTLLAFHDIDEIRVSPYINNLGRMSNVEYKKRIDYFIYNSKKEFSKIKIKRRLILKAFPENKKEIRKIIRQNKILLQDENALIQTIRLIDQAGLMK